MLMHPLFENPVQATEGQVQTLVIESPKLLSQLLGELTQQAHGDAGRYILSLNGKNIELKDKVKLIYDPFSLSCNEKMILSSIYFEIKCLALDEAHYLHTNESLEHLTKYLNNLASEVDLSVFSEMPSIQDIIKAVTPSFEEAYESLLDRICQYLDAIFKHTSIALIIFVNLKKYLNEADYINFVKHIRYEKYKVLLIESGLEGSIKGEEITIIDSDLCEIRSNPII